MTVPYPGAVARRAAPLHGVDGFDSIKMSFDGLVVSFTQERCWNATA